VSYLERKIDLLAQAARDYCGTEATDPRTRHEIALDILECCGRIFSKRDVTLLKKGAALLSVFPLIKKDAEGLFKNKIQEMEDTFLSIQVMVSKVVQP